MPSHYRNSSFDIERKRKRLLSIYLRGLDPAALLELLELLAILRLVK